MNDAYDFVQKTPESSKVVFIKILKAKFVPAVFLHVFNSHFRRKRIEIRSETVGRFFRQKVHIKKALNYQQTNLTS